MSESEEEQDVPGDVGYIVSSGPGGGRGGMKRERRLASKPPEAHLDTFAGSAKPYKPACVHSSDSAGPALRERAAVQPAYDVAERHDCTSHHTGGHDSLYRADAEELSRCQTPQPDNPGGSNPSGAGASNALLSGLAQGYAVPYPDSSTLGMSPRGLKPPMQAAASSRSDGSNANPGDFGGADSPPWSPRRVPPAHLWGEGPPRYPGYRSGGATLSDPPEGVSTNDLVEAARELQVLLDHRASFGLGPLLHAQPYFSSRNTPADRPPMAQCAAMLGPSTPVLQASPLQGSPALHAAHAAPLAGMLCQEEGTLLSPVPMQLHAGGHFPTPCMWELTNVQTSRPMTTIWDTLCADEVTSSREAVASSGNPGSAAPALVPTTTAELMGISPALPARKSLQQQQRRGPDCAPDTPVHKEPVKPDGGSKRAGAPSKDEQASGVPRKRRVTKRRLF